MFSLFPELGKLIAIKSLIALGRGTIEIHEMIMMMIVATMTRTISNAGPMT